MDMTQFASSESKDLKAADFKGQKLKGKIESVSTRTYPAREDQPESTKPVLHFVGREKALVVSPTNTKTLIEAYGKDSDDWVDHEVGLSTKEYEVGTGWIITPLDVEVAYDDDIPF